MGKSEKGRDNLILEATSRTALRNGNWVMIPPYKGLAINQQVNIELGNSNEYQLYNLGNDIGETLNLADSLPDKLRELKNVFEKIRGEETNEIEPLELK
jgi:hypothetical protein